MKDCLSIHINLFWIAIAEFILNLTISLKMYERPLTLKVPEKLQLYGLYMYVHYVVHICDFGMLRVKANV